MVGQRAYESISDGNAAVRSVCHRSGGPVCHTADTLRPRLPPYPSTGEGETASAEQKAEAKQQEAEKRIIPATAIGLERLHAMGVHAKLDAKHVITKRIPIDNVSLAIVVEDGVLRAKPARFKLGEGAIDLAVTLHTDSKPVRAEVEGVLRNVPLWALFKSTAFQDESSGVLDGRMRLGSEGGSVREMAAHADGEAFVAMSRGKISHLLIELIGLDVFESISVAISGDEPIEIRCALAKLEAENGRVKDRSAGGNGHDRYQDHRQG